MSATGSTSPTTAPAVVRAADTTPGTEAARPWAVRMEGIGKKYRLGEIKHINDSLGEGIMRRFDRLLGRDRSNVPTKASREFWAIRGIDLEVARGEAMGIIGPNGAGKSTMLKILSRITVPTEGTMRYRGRLASLLEIGTGFHRELTGLENIYLNGAILGMKRHEINKSYHEIVEFSGVERFIHTPLKFYSSGMYVRLAFSVAAHLRTEIMVVDEVLAVGDAQFQKRCLDKMRDIAEQGRTVIFVSHSMPAVRRLCERCILIRDGRLVLTAGTDEVIESYLSKSELCAELDDRGAAPDKPMHLRTVRLVNSKGEPNANVTRDAPAAVELTYEVNRPLQSVHVVCHVMDDQDRIVFSTGDCDVTQTLHNRREPGLYRARFDLPTGLINEGQHSLCFALGVPFGRNYDRIERAVCFSVLDADAKNRPQYSQRRPGAVVQDIQWDRTLVAGY